MQNIIITIQLFCAFSLIGVNVGIGQSIASETKSLKDVQPDADRGVYAIWYEQDKNVLNLPFVYGGQIMLQWADVQPSERVYDFKKLDILLEKMQQLGKMATVQINGNVKPQFLYKRIATNPKKLSPQIRDPQGSTLQFWDPLYLKFYIDFLKAYGAHIKNSRFKKYIIGVRLNNNPIGTEHYFNDIGSELYKAKDEDKDYHNYNPTPGGHRYEYSFNDSILSDYMDQVSNAFISAFTPNVKVFIRYDGLMPGRRISPALSASLKSGKLAIFMTNSDARHARNFKTQIFLDYCRTGKAIGYAEQFSDAEGHHAGGLMNFPQWSSAWNYWRLIGDLDNGISYIAIYGSDLAKDKDPEFHDAFLFAKNYVGYHRSPGTSPGAWIALRTPGIITKEKVIKSGPLENLSFLMDERDTGGTMVTNVGPKDQRYGAWARSVSKGHQLSFMLDPLFAKTIKGTAVQLHVIYLDDGNKPFTITYSNNNKPVSKTIERANTQRWKQAVIEIPAAMFTSSDTVADITLSGGGIFHLIEVSKNKK
jgi:hypothetical protein